MYLYESVVYVCSVNLHCNFQLTLSLEKYAHYIIYKCNTNNNSLTLLHCDSESDSVGELWVCNFIYYMYVCSVCVNMSISL